MARRTGPAQPAFVDPDETKPEGDAPVMLPLDNDEEETATQESAEEGRVPNVVASQDEPEFPAPLEQAAPAWAKVPADLKMPHGVVVAYFRFKANWTAASHKGDRQCIIWSLTDKDERLALTRCADSPMNAQNELSKQMIRAIDGVKVDW